ncbi:MAG: type IV pili twitching motility protein PilT [Candidatus Anoxymicrobium japonicum]|uniref:Type IV pili twitching motility protein PilT n=1 Tax=Candidatus Anoxymicrobium japonicum TaxID=2013648 RepID=A0A2N3G4V2_9ACTN|nr:MAG: type IV pili twitching motility protein PilT [Candidatus Anoxymicrobium japonicum]
MDLHALLKLSVENNASDIHIKAGGPPYLRVDGALLAADFPPLSPVDVVEVAFSLMNEKQARAFHDTNEADFAYSVSGLGRFRANVFKQRGTIGISIRRVLTTKIPKFDELGLPPVLKRLSEEARGLLLVTGPTGSGKTTTIASMVDHLNENQRLNIVTIEDPIEILHVDKKCIIHQREIGTDTDSYREALRHVTRQDPDVILIGEMRDIETVTSALNIAMTGHLVLSTFHTQDTTETVNRMIDFFPPTQQRQVRITLTSTLAGIVSQRLLARCDGGGRVPAVEVMIMNGRLSECLLNEEPTAVMREIIADSEFYGMQTFNQSLVALYADGLIDFQTAIKATNQAHDFILMAKQMGLPVEELLSTR